MPGWLDRDPSRSGLCHLGPDRIAALTAQVEAATASGLRVLAVARASFDRHRDLPGGQHDFDFEYLGLVGLHDPVSVPPSPPRWPSAPGPACARS